ncbi:uncharacterized protein LOC113514003 [Galleria mellonella]|uniref:Uncharacterized protein LOC113514003 n=1 Tax=Galleria mellonella TaxID=7137 RepID=A0A6J1WQ26_GALME|nr:uncharacterized protein LOC113514003 [Galleria mellonella]
MVQIELLVVITFAVLVCSSEVEDVEQKKRGAGKGTSLNSIPTGAQKPEYTYSIYSQSSGTSNNSPSSTYQSPNPSYQSSVPNSFYPSQNAQYYNSNSLSSDTSYQQPPQINLPPTTSSQFVPLNFIPNPGYQAKYQLVPSKASNGNIQLAIIQQPTSFPSPAYLQYPQSLLSPNPNQIHGQQNPFGSISPHGLNVAAGFQPLSLNSPYLGQQSAMLLLSQPNPSLYNNLLYPNPVPSFYNYYPSNSQAKYNVAYGGTSQSPEYDKLQGPLTSQNLPKDDSDVHSTEYISSDVNNYKSAYATSRGPYAKLK